MAMFAIAAGLVVAPLAGIAIQSGLKNLLDFDEK
jgi:hypothetical protein